MFMHGSTIASLSILLSRLVKQWGDQRVASAKGAHVLATSFPPSVYRPELKAATFGFKYREVRPVPLMQLPSI